MLQEPILPAKLHFVGFLGHEWQRLMDLAKMYSFSDPDTSESRHFICDNFLAAKPRQFENRLNSQRSTPLARFS